MLYHLSMKAIVLLLLFSLIASGASKNLCQHDDKTFRCVKYLKNYDGDTVTVKIPNVHPLLGENITVRVHGVDTPEKTGKGPCEKERARDAQRLVENLMKNAKNIELRNVDRDKYFRVLAEVWVDGQSLSQILIKNKVANHYDGGRKPANFNWCR